MNYACEAEAVARRSGSQVDIDYATRSAHVITEGRHHRHELQARTDGTFGIVLVRDRDTSHAHHRVAYQLLDQHGVCERRPARLDLRISRPQTGQLGTPMRT